jgi:uncharacterized SAM-binding protein YcdF (DUF218 family)
MCKWERLWSIADNPPVRPSCFIIPSYALKDRSLPTKPTRTQIDLAVEWWKRFPDAKIIMSTGDNQGLGVTNSTVMAEYAKRQGVPRENIIEEGRSLNTYQNLVYSMEIMREQNLSQPTLVTLDLYTKRAVATARKLGWKNFYWISVYSKGQPAYGYKWLQTYSRFTIFIYEISAMIYSKIVGWV